MFHKINRAYLRSTYKHIKSHIGRAYHTTKDILNAVDNGVRYGKKIYSIVAPAIDHYAGNNSTLHKSLMHGLSAYDNIKNHVIEHHTRGSNAINSLKSHGIDPGF